MARFIQPQKQDIISMHTPQNLEFYTNMLDRAQGNLDKATAMKAAALEKYGDLTAYTKEDRNSTWGAANESLANILNDDYVSPSKVANKVMELNRQLTPGIHALKAKEKAVEQWDKLQMAYGADAWMGADPRQQSIQQDGQFVDPGSFKAHGINAVDIDKAFLASQMSNLTRQGELSYSRAGAPTNMYKTRQTTGLSDEDRENDYGVGTDNARQIAEQILETQPEILNVYDRETAIDKIMRRNYQTSGNYTQKIDANYMRDAIDRSNVDNSPIPPPGLYIPPVLDVPTLNDEVELTNNITTEFETKTANMFALVTGKIKYGTDEYKKTSSEMYSYMKKYKDFYDQTVNEYATENKLNAAKIKTSDIFSRNPSIMVNFMDKVRDYEIGERVVADRRLQFTSGEFPSFFTYLNGLEDNVQFKSKEDPKKIYTVKDLKGADSKPISTFVDDSPIQLSMKDGKVYINHSEKGLLEVPSSALDGSFNRAVSFAQDVEKLVKNHTGSTKAIRYSVPTEFTHLGERTYPVVYKRDGLTYMAYASGKNNSDGTPDIFTTSDGKVIGEYLLDNDWSPINAMLVRAMNSSYANKLVPIKGAGK